MGKCWSCIIGDKSNQAPVPAAKAPIPEPIPDPDPSPSTIEPIPDAHGAPSTIDNLTDGDISFLGSNFSGTNWFSIASTNFSALLSQASGAIAAIWGEDNDFLPAIDDDALPDDGALPDWGSAPDSKLRAFTFGQLKAATLNFRSEMVLGKGGFGSVYKGWLKEKVPPQGIKKWPVAVKRLDSRSKQGIRQWRTEVGFLARLSHPNIIKLVGYCRENEEFLIVYEFMHKGSLNYHLFGKGSNRLLPWTTRVKIAIGMAKGLSYLHTMEKPIIFRDFKSSNVLLDESYTPKISDLGLAKWEHTAGNIGKKRHVVGTTGYVAPEYVEKGQLYVKSDVYGFGVVLLEMLTGLRAIDKGRPPGQQHLVRWLKPKLPEKSQLKHVIDPRLEGKYPMKQASKIAILAVLCLYDTPQYRPSMKEVAETLERIEAERV